MKVMFVMLNPSKATEEQNDPTVERCERRARTLGYGAFCVTNLFGWRATDPADLRRVKAPVGPDNGAIVETAIRWADHIIAAWGTHGAYQGQGPQMASQLFESGVPVFHLGLSKDGHPKHPLYLPYKTEPVLWSPSEMTR